MVPYGIVPMVFFILACAGTKAKKTDLKDAIGYEYAETDKSLLWELRQEGVDQPSFIYGTIHIQRAEVFAFDSLIYRILDTVSAFAMEVNMDELNPFAAAKMMMMEKPLDELISPEKYKALDSIFIAKTGQGIGMMKTTKPFFLMAMLMKDEMGGEMEEPLDLHFFSYSKAKNKKLIGVEKFEEQMAAVDQLTIEEQVDIILDGAKDTSSTFNKFDELMNTYLEQDLEEMIELSQDTTYPPKFNKAFITDRNIHMAERIPGIAKDQPTFIAIGAAHLGGPQGVLALLREKGYSVKPIKLEFKK